MGIYLPNKWADIDGDEFFNLDVLHRVIEKNIKEITKSNKVKLLFILTHQGFLEDEYWSLQYEVREEERKKKGKNDADEKVDKWKNCVKMIREVLWKYDNDSGRENMPHIVMVSGHTHRGFFVRTPNRIEHINCPSLAQGDRAKTERDKTEPKRMGKGAYLRIDYYPEENKIDIKYENIYFNNKDNEKNKNRATLYL